MAASPDGSRVFVTGFSRENLGGDNYATVAYSTATGAQLWALSYNGTDNVGDFAYSVAASPSRVFVAGSSQFGLSRTIAYSG